MVRTLSTLIAGFAAALVLSSAAPAEACEAHAKAKQAEPAPAKAPADQSVLQPVDEILAGKCNCSGPSDCTCKKGECRCKKCEKQHQDQKTQLLEPLRGTPLKPRLPQNARFDATAGVFI